MEQENIPALSLDISSLLRSLLLERQEERSHPSPMLVELNKDMGKIFNFLVLENFDDLLVFTSEEPFETNGLTVCNFERQKKFTQQTMKEVDTENKNLCKFFCQGLNHTCLRLPSLMICGKKEQKVTIVFMTLNCFNLLKKIKNLLQPPLPVSDPISYPKIPSVAVKMMRAVSDPIPIPQETEQLTEDMD